MTAACRKMLRQSINDKHDLESEVERKRRKYSKVILFGIAPDERKITVLTIGLEICM